MQKDLFGTAAVAAMPDTMSAKISFLDRYRMSVRLDQALFLLIGLLVIYVLVFSFGVETGKRYAMSELKAERLKRERMVDELRDKVFPPQPALTASASSLNSQKGELHSVPASETAAAPVETVSPVVEAPQQPIQTATNAQNRKFTIQILTIASKAAAEKEVKRLSEKGMSGFIISRGKLNEVCVNGFDSHKQALQQLKELKTQGMVPADAYVRSIAG